jgi:hypothetical protein
VFFDEAESLDSLERVSRQFAETVLRYFALATVPQAELPFAPSELYRGGQAVHRALPHLVRADQPLIACFAFTPLPAVARAVELAGGGAKRVMDIAPLPRQLLPQLAERIVTLYRELHPDMPITAEQIEGLLQHVDRGVRLDVLASTRAITRLTVEYLDLVRHRPDQARVALAPI